MVLTKCASELLHNLFYHQGKPNAAAAVCRNHSDTTAIAEGMRNGQTGCMKSSLVLHQCVRMVPTLCPSELLHNIFICPNAAAAADYSRQYERWREGLLGTAAPMCQNGSDTAAMRAVERMINFLSQMGNQCYAGTLP